MLCICKETFKKDYEQKFLELYGKELTEGTDYNKYEALASLVRDYIATEWLQTDKRYHNAEVKQIYYFSMEFLLGRLLSSSLLNLGIRDLCKEALEELGINLEKIEDLEHDQGLGNGGLGRLAACFLDSMASLNIPGHGCGIRYKYGFFQQKIIDGSQVEFPDNWLKENNVWEIKRQDKSVVVKFYGTVNMEKDEEKLIFTHINYEPVLAVPYDTPVVGFKNGTVNTLRLWSAEPLGNDFDFSSFRRGDFLKAIEYKNSIEAIS
ncbi:MAG: glycogen/starch/alpha-glucan phosphorylase, partial [Clostridium sp.]